MFTQDYKQKATYWSSPSIDGWGTKTFGSPEIIKCRWENEVGRFITHRGEDAVSRAHVWVVDPLDLSGYLFLGESAALDPTTVNGAYEIRLLFETPDLRNAFVERKVYL